MRQAVIIGNGDFPRKEYPREILRRADVIVCCDRGLEAFLRNRDRIFGRKREADVIIGDMDSLSRRLIDEYSDRLVHISEQDDNDQTKAVRYILDHFKDVDTIHFLGATGKRECHTIGNLSLLMEYAREFGMSGNPADGEIMATMVSDYSTAFAITDTCVLHVGEGRAISIFSPDNSLKIKSEGLEWPTDEVVFDNWWKATLNRASRNSVKLTFSHKSIGLIILD
jgi:thiamine pyrophosphokinase